MEPNTVLKLKGMMLNSAYQFAIVATPQHWAAYRSNPLKDLRVWSSMDAEYWGWPNPNERGAENA